MQKKIINCRCKGNFASKSLLLALLHLSFLILAFTPNFFIYLMKPRRAGGRILPMQHPASGFSWDNWHPVIEEFLAGL